MNIVSTTSNRYGESVNHPDTWDFIAHELINHGSFVISWSDEHLVQLTVLFSYPQPIFSTEAELFVTIPGYGMSSIRILSDSSQITPTSIEKDFGIKSKTQTASKLCTLLHEVKQRLI